MDGRSVAIVSSKLAETTAPLLSSAPWLPAGLRTSGWPADLKVFTMPDLGVSRCRDLGVHEPAIRAFTIARYPHLDEKWRRDRVLFELLGGALNRWYGYQPFS